MRKKSGGLKSRLPFLLIVNLLPVLLQADELAWRDADDYIQLSYRAKRKEKDGSVSLPLIIKYGCFSGEAKNISALKSLRAFYCTEEKGAEKDWLFRELPVTVRNGVGHLLVRSPGTNRFTVLVTAEQAHDGRVCFYSAKTSFVLFGHALFAEGKKPETLLHPGNRLDISFAPRFDYWPQTGSKITIVTSLDGKTSAAPIRIYDENFPVVSMKAEKNGKCVYTPPNDPELNWNGSTAFKQMTAVVRKRQDGNCYISSYTRILHRSRTGNRKLLPGLVVFGACTASLLALVIVKRRRSRGVGI